MTDKPDDKITDKMNELTHIDSTGKVKMVDISNKNESLRTAVASGYILLNEEIISKVKKNEIQKGDVLAAAKIAGINAYQPNWELIPLCHQIKLTGIEINFRIEENTNKIISTAIISGYDRTGVEMEALAAVSVSLLTIYDMCKALSKKMIINNIELLKKSGGKSDYER
ncbi:MAG: cyclic pyranopterin monophosphate synthase MoaC [Actinobacteria bacterium]|nr:cyclic pyranopterin monophosphate synthase MoaC [Actinomycetota bacterium]